MLWEKKKKWNFSAVCQTRKKMLSFFTGRKKEGFKAFCFKIQKIGSCSWSKKKNTKKNKKNSVVTFWTMCRKKKRSGSVFW